jgi:predicted ATPase
MTGDVRADNTRRLLVRILRSVASASPLLLLVEDAHWLDSTSWSLLLEIARGVQPLLTVVAARPPAEPVPAEYLRLTRLPSTRLLHLEGLTPEETVTLVANRLGVRAVPDALAGFVQERVSGHPFFCEELLQTMLESGAIRVADGACTIGDLEDSRYRRRSKASS